MTYDFDLFTIGAGSGGVRASRIAAGHGARVAVAEDYRAGGTCVIRGCVPKKLLVYASHVHEDVEDAAGYGWDIAEPSHSWEKLIAAKNKEIDRLENIYHGLLSNAGATEIKGRGRVVGPNAVEVDGKTYTAERILIATGGWPVVPDIPGKEHAITSNEALELPEMPKRVAIVGGGYIAVEFAGIFNGLGAEVTQIIRKDKILRGFDEDMRDGLQVAMADKGVNFLTGVNVTRIDKADSGLTLSLDTGESLEVDAVMYATGRAPNSGNMGLEEVGVALKPNGAIAVNEWSQTSVDSIFAVGDVTDRIALTPVAIQEGHAFADTFFGDKPRRVDHSDVPSAVFSQPPIGTVGLTEAEARARYDDIDIYRSSFRPMKATLSGRQERAVMKLIVDRNSDAVLGAHMLGPDAPEIIQGIGIAVKMGATKADFDATVGIHPSSAEEFVTMRTPVPDPARSEAAE
ncbi:MAG: glutathione-disulfide reductase [Alphaproteobacteria bacterium]|nr:glutathione-disulfide reductase [Alphaproteobacteria bacterium]